MYDSVNLMIYFVFLITYYFTVMMFFLNYFYVIEKYENYLLLIFIEQYFLYF